jgi:hypothetical protein
MQTNVMVDSLLSDASVAHWKKAGDGATTQQISDLSVFCSQCLIQFTLMSLGSEPARVSLNPVLGADRLELVRLMYGDFSRGSATVGLTFDKSLGLGNLNDPQEIHRLTELVDQLICIQHVSDDWQREVKIQKLQELFGEHQRAFAYTLHSVH